MSAPDAPEPSDSERARREEADRWLVIVRDDIDVALAAIDLARPRAGVAAYHLQQAAEKLLKAMLVLTGQAFRRTHDLEDLVGQTIPFYPELATEIDPLRPLTVWGIAYRYPGLEDDPEPEPTLGELRESANVIGRLAARFTS